MGHQDSIDEIRDACQAIEDEWIEFNSDFDDLKEQIDRLTEEIHRIERHVDQSIDFIKEQEIEFQTILANQPTLNAKLEKFEQLKVENSQKYFYIDMFSIRLDFNRNVAKFHRSSA